MFCVHDIYIIKAAYHSVIHYQDDGFTMLVGDTPPRNAIRVALKVNDVCFIITFQTYLHVNFYFIYMSTIYIGQNNDVEC